MNKTKKNLIFLGVGILFFVAMFFFMFSGYFNELFGNNISQTHQIKNKKVEGIVLRKRPSQAHIFALEIEISPNKTSNYSLQIGNNKSFLYSVTVKKGVEYVYESRWEDSICIINYTPEKESEEIINMDYRFISKN